METGSGDMLMDEHQLGLWGRPSVAMATVSRVERRAPPPVPFLIGPFSRPPRRPVCARAGPVGSANGGAPLEGATPSSCGNRMGTTSGGQSS